MLLVSLFAVAGVTLAAIGLYGVMAYLVSRRTPELAIRMALGADRRSVVAMVVLEGMRTVAIGGVAGLLRALAAGSLMSHLRAGCRVLGAACEVALELTHRAAFLEESARARRRGTKHSAPSTSAQHIARSTKHIAHST